MMLHIEIGRLRIFAVLGSHYDIARCAAHRTSFRLAWGNRRLVRLGPSPVLGG
jgi:hypothetical protein